MKPILGPSFVAMLCGAQTFAACPPLPIGGAYDRPVRVGAQCAFTGAAGNDSQGQYSGTAVEKTEAGLFVQRLTRSQTACDHVEILVVVDCASKSMAAFWGKAKPISESDTHGQPVVGPRKAYIANIAEPVGPLPVQTAAGLDDLTDLAETYRIYFTQEPNDLMVDDTAKNQFDPMCACSDAMK